MVQDPEQGIVAFAGVVPGVNEFGGVVAQQVVEGVPAGQWLLDETGPGELGE